MGRKEQLKFQTAIITYPSDYDGWLTLQILTDYYQNIFFKDNTTIKVVIAKENADEEIQRDHYHIYLDSPTQLQLNQKYLDVPLPEPCFVFINKDSTRSYQFFSVLASRYGIESLHDPTMADKIDLYIERELSGNDVKGWEILQVAHPNLQLKKQYGDKYFMLKYVVKQHLISRANFDVDEELKYLQDHCEKLCEKANQLIQDQIMQELNVKTIPELINLLKKYISSMGLNASYVTKNSAPREAYLKLLN